ncbi:MAG: DNA cytosine methyltransferase [Gemmatimonadaceae bacterium]|nr:DNA cytosine methyltransferase [Gemmatimonadaceae bacterium]
MQTLKAVDLFAGAGGATAGLRGAGFQVVYAVDSDAEAAASYCANHAGTQVEVADIRELSPCSVRDALYLAPGELALLKTCPPCQPYSSLSRSKDRRLGSELVRSTVEWVDAFEPTSVMFENVPGVATSNGFKDLVKGLRAREYDVDWRVLNAAQFGVPQKRRRLILVALKGHSDGLGEDFWTPVAQRVRSAAAILRGMLKLEGQDELLDRPRKLSAMVQRRVNLIPQNGSRFDLPKHLQLKCHQRLDSRSAAEAYGRIRSTGPCATITTRCTTVSCGRFVHPDRNRGLTLREAAVLQSFPPTYKFVGSHGTIERQIGNAVPAKLVEVVAGRLAHLLKG